MSANEIADEIIRLVEQTEDTPHSFDEIKKKSLEDGCLLCFNFQDTNQKYEVVIIRDTIKEALYYNGDGGVMNEENLTKEEVVEFLYM